MCVGAGTWFFVYRCIAALTRFVYVGRSIAMSIAWTYSHEPPLSSVHCCSRASESSSAVPAEATENPGLGSCLLSTVTFWNVEARRRADSSAWGKRRRVRRRTEKGSGFTLRLNLYVHVHVHLPSRRLNLYNFELVPSPGCGLCKLRLTFLKRLHETFFCEFRC